MSITDKRPNPNLANLQPVGVEPLSGKLVFAEPQPERPLFSERFQHAQYIERKRIVMPSKYRMRLNRGELPESLPRECMEMIFAGYPVEQMQRYPNYTPLYEALSAHTGFPMDWLVAGAGIEDFIRAYIALCCETGDPFAVTWPTCAMYQIHGQTFGAPIQTIMTDPSEEWTAEGLIENLSGFEVKARLVFLPNPGQPVETYLHPLEVREVAKWCSARNIVLAIDEAHWGFGAESCLPLTKEFDNVVVMRTFSKLFGAASIRVGYVVGNPRVVRPVDALRLSGEVAGPSMHAAIRLMANYAAFVVPNAQKVAEARDWLREKINAMPGDLRVRADGEKGFSILISFGSQDTKDEVVCRLEAQGILVKGNFGYPLDHHILLACGKKPLMEKFYAAFVEALGEAP